MVSKYVRVLENREMNVATGNTWSINDVPNLWKNKVVAKVEEDGYYFLDDGTVKKVPVNE